MGLVKCPDCGKQISDSASSCINCGRPMRGNRDKISAEINIKLEELRNSRKALDDDRQYYEDNPREAEAGWWNGHYSNISKLEEEIEDLKNKL